MMDKLLAAASILGVMVIGCMSKDMVWTTLNVELSKVGEEVTTLQSILDGIMPGLIGLGDTWMYFWLLKSNQSDHVDSGNDGSRYCRCLFRYTCRIR